MKKKTGKIAVPRYEELLKPVRYNMVLAGIPFEQNPKATTRYYVLWITLFVMIIGEVAFMVNVTSEKFLELTALVPCTAIGFLSLTKTTFIYRNRNSAMDLVKRLEILYLQYRNEQKWMSLVGDDVNFVRSLTVSYVILNQMLVWTYNLSSLILMIYTYLVENRLVYVLPYPVALPFEVNSWFRWSVVYLYSVANAFVTVLNFCTVDCFYYILTCLICTNFAILNARIKELSSETSEDLLELIKDHQYLLKLSSQLETIFTGPNLLNVLIGSLQICVLGFNLTIGGWEQAPPSLLFISSVLLQILMMSMFGEKLIEQSSETGASVYSCAWTSMDAKSRKLLMIMQRR
ncbi:Odorant receptor 85c [Eumeta japonica]|uniref:Odorant receptor n=1 Tax=Eumeta variegata TaxID=151549 RepID=A0A4C1Y9C0_EUMVA|nr:Odorant receptor 85c [Eumeta japonica]